MFKINPASLKELFDDAGSGKFKSANLKEVGCRTPRTITVCHGNGPRK